MSYTYTEEGSLKKKKKIYTITLMVGIIWKPPWNTWALFPALCAQRGGRNVHVTVVQLISENWQQWENIHRITSRGDFKKKTTEKAGLFMNYMNINPFKH